MRRSFVLSALLVASLGTATLIPPAYAAGLEGYDQNYLISDSAMYGDVADSLSVDEIQRVLDDKGAACVQGKDGSPCLKNATFDSQSFPASPYCENAFEGKKGHQAAQIIADVAHSCRVSPKVLIVMLQKEQGLVTTTNPTRRNYERATGFACPDSAPCDPAKAGFPTQVYAAASRLQQYRLEPQRFNFAVGRQSEIAYHPEARCGKVVVKPKNAATAALFNYTPYVPNAAALANPYGQGDSCSSYGNRNFFRTHNDWFGQPNIDPAPAVAEEKTAQKAPAAPAPEQPKNTPTTVKELSLTGYKTTVAASTIHSAFPVGNWDGQALADAAHVTSTGDLILHPHQSETSYGSPRRIGQGWGILHSIMGGVDWDGNGTPDLLSIDPQSRLRVYAGNGKSGFVGVSHIGNGWNMFDEVLPIQSGPGGMPALLGQGKVGNYVYPTNGKGNWKSRVTAKLPNLKGAIAGPDLWGNGYSTLIVPENTRTIAFYATKDGSNYERKAIRTTPFAYARILNVSAINGQKRFVVDVAGTDNKITSLIIASEAVLQVTTRPSAPVQPAARPQSQLWPGASFVRSTQAGAGWPSRHVYSLADFNGDSQTEAAIMWSDGRFAMYPSQNQGASFKGAIQIGAGWTILRDFHTGVDFNGDTRPDIIGRMPNGELRIYPGNGRGGFDKYHAIGHGWSRFDTIKVLRQGPGGHPVVIGIEKDTIRLYPTNGRGAFIAPQNTVGGYPWGRAAIASDDWNNDGLSDLLLMSDGGMLYVAFQEKNGFGNPRSARIGSGFTGFTAFIPAYFTADQKSIWAVDSGGRMKLFVWKSKLKSGAFSAPSSVKPAVVPQSSYAARVQKNGSWLKHPVAWTGQPDDESCGPTSMYMVLNYLGAHRSAYDGKSLSVWTLKGRDYANVGTGWSGGTSWEDSRLAFGMNRWLGRKAYNRWTFPTGAEYRDKVVASFKTGRPVVVDTIENYGGPHYNGHVGRSSHIIVTTEYNTFTGEVGFADPGGPGSAISGYSAQRYFRYPSAVSFGNNFLGNYGGGGHGMVF